MNIRSIVFVLLMMGCAVLATGELYLTIPLGVDIARQYHVDATSSGRPGATHSSSTWAAGTCAIRRIWACEV